MSDTTHKVTKTDLESMIGNAVQTAVEDIKKENEALKTKIEEVETSTKAMKEKPKENNMPFYEDYVQTKAHDFKSIAVNFMPEQFSDQWFRDATPSQRFIAQLKGLKDQDERLVVNSWALGALAVKSDGTPLRDFSREERMACANLVSKDLSSGTANAGGVLVAPDYRQELINCLYQDKSGLMGQWTKWITSTGAETYAPSLVSGATVHWIGEGETKTESNPVFGQYSWKPKKQIVKIDLTEELLMDASPDAGVLVKNEHRRVLELDSLYCFFYGDGVNQPRGINLDIPAANTAFVGAVFNSEDLKILKCLVRQDYRPGGWFYAHDCVWCQVERFTNLLGYEWQMSMNDMLKEGVPPQILGYNYYRGVDETMPIGFAETGTGTGAFGHVFFGNPKNYIAVIRDMFRVKFDGTYDFDKNIVSFITESRWDGRMVCDTFSKLEGVNC